MLNTKNDEASMVSRWISNLGNGDLNMTFWKLCKAGIETDFRLFIKYNLKVINVNWQNENYYGYTSLHICCQKGHCEIAKILITELNADVNIQGTGMETPLHEAIHEKHELIALLLLQYGADTNKATSLGKTPMDFAKKHGFDNLLLYLFDIDTKHKQRFQETSDRLAEEIQANKKLREEIILLKRKISESAAILSMVGQDPSSVVNTIRMQHEEIHSWRAKSTADKKIIENEIDMLKDKLMITDTQRRQAERNLGDSRVEIDYLHAQLQEVEKLLKATMDDNQKLDELIESRKSAVGYPIKRTENGPTNASPRSIRLRPLEPKAPQPAQAETRVQEIAQPPPRIRPDPPTTNTKARKDTTTVARNTKKK